jgi:glycosyltransferase involved in cell wall biosynthesis
MKVALLTPMSPESAIGDVMVQAMPTLMDRWDLEVWCPEETLYRSCPVPLRPYRHPTDQLLDALARFDLVIYVIGDSWRHASILPLARRLPGLLVLHDASLTNLIRYAAIEQNELEALCDHIRQEYGPEEADVMRDSTRAGSDLEWLRYCERVALAEMATEWSLGAVVHSRWHAKRIDGTMLGGVTVASLPVPSMDMGFEDEGPKEEPAQLEQLDDRDLLLITVGAVNANRRIDVLLEAMAFDQDVASAMRLWAVGPVDDRAASELIRRARSLGIEDRFTITGQVSDAYMSRVLARADIAAALRDPVLEGQSASLLTQMKVGIPTIVFDQAHYSEHPDEVVVKVDPDDGSAGVARALRALIDDPEERSRRGQLSRDYVMETHSAEGYARALIDAGERAPSARPLVNLTLDTGSLLRRVGLHRDDGVVERVSDFAFDLYQLA